METQNKLRFTKQPQIETGDAEQKRKDILQYFQSTFELFEKLFDTIKDKKSLSKQPEPLRRPLIFYLGHTAAFFINKLTIPGHLKQRVNPKFESMFQDDVDEMDWDDLDSSHYEYPSYEETMEFRRGVRATIEKFIEEVPLQVPIQFGQGAIWIILMGIEYERLQIENTSLLIRRLPIGDVQPSELFPVCQESALQGYDKLADADKILPQNGFVEVADGEVSLNKDDGYYGWDNQFGKYSAKVQGFKASKYLASNYEFLQFVNDGGYTNKGYWTEEGVEWLNSSKVTHPIYWVPIGDGKYKLRTLTNEIDMPWDWPVEVNFHEAKAFANYKSEKTGQPIRLPSESEYHRLRTRIPDDVGDWKEGSRGNINLEVYGSPCPVNKFGADGIYDVVGNVWQHTESLFDQFEGFKVFWLFDDFSTTKFDSKHNVLKGGSYISTGNTASQTYRSNFRRHFYCNAGIRYIESANPVSNREDVYETDFLVSSYLEFHYQDTVNFGVENYPKVCARLVAEACKANGVKLGRALDLGCAVGRSTFAFAKEGFQEAIGIDLSARFFQNAFKLREKGQLKYQIISEGSITEHREITLKGLGLEEVKDRVKFYQGDASNLNQQKLGKFDVVFGGNLLCRMKYPKKFLRMVHELLNPGGMVVFTSPCTWLTEWTEKKEWVGGFKKDGENFTTLDGLREILKEKFDEVKEAHEVPFVIKETKRKFQHSFAQATYWKLK